MNSLVRCFVALSCILFSQACNMSVMKGACILQWDCHNSVTVEIRRQGQDWKKVAGCTELMTQSCNLSQTNMDYNVYYFVQLRHSSGQSHTTETTELMNFDPCSHAIFRDPSVSLALNQSQLTAVAFYPCPINSCNQNCCSSYMVGKPITTITLYNAAQPSQKQVCSKETQGETIHCEFGEQRPGHKYCATANFNSRSISPPSCIYVPSEPAVLKHLLLAGVVCIISCIPAVFLYILKRRCVSDKSRLPRALESLQDEASRELRTSQEECADDRLSFLSPSGSIATTPPSVLGQDGAIEDGYYSNHNPMDWVETDGESGGAEESPSTPPLVGSPSQQLVGLLSIDVPLSSVWLCLPEEGDHEALWLPRRTDEQSLGL